MRQIASSGRAFAHHRCSGPNWRYDPAVSTRWPFVGRREELDVVGAAMADPTMPGMVLAGAAGVGKSRLLHEAVRGIDSARCLARSVVATPATSEIPFGALAPLLPADLPNATSPTNLLRFAADALARPAGSRRLVVGVDDAHVLDDVSAGLLHQLAQAGQAFVLASVRTGEPAPEPITALWKDQLVERIEVQALSRREMAGVLSTVVGGHVDETTADRLWQATQGNMLFLRELVDAGLDTGALAEVEGIWRWEGEWVMAPRLAELLTHRIGRLDPDEHRLLELVAYGAPIGVDSLTRLVEPELLQAVEAKNLVWVSEERSEVYLSHPLYGEVLRSECPLLRARSWKRLLADAVQDTGATRNDDWLRIASWRLDAGVPVSPDVLMRAVEQAWSVFDLPLTERLAREAIAAGAGIPAIRILWRCLFLSHRGTEVEELLARWMLAPLPDVDRDDLVVGRAINLFWGLDRTDQAFAVLRDAEQGSGDQGQRETYAAMRALFLHHTAAAPECVAAADEVLASEPINPYAKAMAGAARCMAQTYLAELDSLSTLLEVRTAVTPWQDELPFLGVMVDLGLAQTLLYGGKLAEATALVDGAFERAEAGGPDFAAYIYRVARAQAARLAGRPRTARRILREGLGRYRRQHFGWYQVPAFLLGELAHVEAMLGNTVAAAGALNEADADPRVSVRIFDIWADLARPWVAVAEGNRPAAIELATGCVEKARRLGAKGIEAAALHDLVRLGEPRKAVDRLAELSERIRGGFVRLAAAHARAAVDNDPGGLAEVADGFERIGADLLAAEAYAAAGAGFDAAGRASSARSARAKAGVLLERCEGARTPAVDVVSAPDLTPREHDIARLAAGGLSNREIAERLVLSKRTVDNHLHQVYAKLGIGGRAELAGVLAGSESEYGDAQAHKRSHP